MNQTTLIVPSWASTVVHFLERNWVAIVGIAIIALLSCIVTEIVKHKFSVKYEEDKAKSIVRWSLVAITAGFTVLGSVIYFLQQNSMSLGKIPFIGQNEVEVLGAAWTLYNFRLNKTFAKFRANLASWSDAKVSNVTAPMIAPTVEPVQPTPPATEVTIS